MIEETKYLKVIVALVFASLIDIKWMFPILLSIASFFSLQDYLNIRQIIILIALFFVFTLFFLMIHLATKEIKEKNEKITPSVHEIFNKEPEDVILKNYYQIFDIKNLNGDCTVTVKEKLARLSGKKLNHWLYLVGNSNIPEYMNMKAYKLDNGEPITNLPLKVEPYLKQKKLQVFQIDFLTSKEKEIEFMIEYSINRIFSEMLTVGEWIEMEFSRPLEKYKFEIKLPNGVQRIEKCCITKKAKSGEIIENGCYSLDEEGNLVPLEGTCFPPGSQIEKELNITKNVERKILSLESNSGLNKDDYVRIWWLCSKTVERVERK
jgi:hypothetical protein